MFAPKKTTALVTAFAGAGMWLPAVYFLSQSLDLPGKAMFERTPIEWLAIWLKVDKGQPSADQQADLLELLHRFRMETLEVVEKETQTWIAEFSRNLMKLDSIARVGKENLESRFTRPRQRPTGER